MHGESMLPGDRNVILQPFRCQDGMPKAPPVHRYSDLLRFHGTGLCRWSLLADSSLQPLFQCLARNSISSWKVTPSLLTGMMPYCWFLDLLDITLRAPPRRLSPCPPPCTENTWAPALARMPANTPWRSPEATALRSGARGFWGPCPPTQPGPAQCSPGYPIYGLFLATPRLLPESWQAAHP